MKEPCIRRTSLACSSQSTGEGGWLPLEGSQGRHPAAVTRPPPSARLALPARPDALRRTRRLSSCSEPLTNCYPRDPARVATPPRTTEAPAVQKACEPGVRMW
ncbi:hypothetical protein PYCCODRAFT_731660 [Trametes coccinea BRFM310]|uniref:Uncharacterized protein n=1 Tax=Trametes coccinea (strain BRFM310) TaxID=1353009 RepID=A0A1Y2IHG5_TRAC3|nr:hypothetical protein PYCCODRAFT_731660 [Trametes coccinea BRFM310]